jgi:hypothetical protein
VRGLLPTIERFAGGTSHVGEEAPQRDERESVGTFRLVLLLGLVPAIYYWIEVAVLGGARARDGYERARCCCRHWLLSRAGSAWRACSGDPDPSYDLARLDQLVFPAF